MTNEKFEILIEKVVANAPTWLKEDLDNIAKKADSNIRITFVISELYSRYTFGFRHITSAMAQSSEWSITSNERLNFIDNNIDLIQFMIKRIQS